MVAEYLTIDRVFEFIGSALGMAGGWLVSGKKTKIARIRLGFWLWLISDIFLVALGVMLARPFFTTMMLYYTITSWRGIINNKESA